MSSFDKIFEKAQKELVVDRGSLGWDRSEFETFLCQAYSSMASGLRSRAKISVVQEVLEESIEEIKKKRF